MLDLAYCTLFNCNYLDKGIVMISSLLDVAPTSHVYVLCMDEYCKVILDDIFLGGIKTIALESFEDEELLKIKPTRSAGEYCWTCTAKLIQYIIKYFHEPICTYVDSDLFFYSDPSVLIEEMLSKSCSVQVVSHHFLLNSRGKRLEKESGKNCVQFNTFTDEQNSMDLLQWWIDQCLLKCSVETAGDQMYTSDWGKKTFVNVSTNYGAGVAPWNINRFQYMRDNYIRDVPLRKEFELVFYHFQGVINQNRYYVSIEPFFQYWKVDKKFLQFLYYGYIKKLEDVKKAVEAKYGFLPIVQVYISDKHSGYSMAQRILANVRQPMPILLEKMNYRLRFIVRKRFAVIDVRRL